MDERESKPIEQLLCEARGGIADRNSLFESCRSYLHVLARTHVESWLRAKTDASDLVQQTLLEAHRDFERFSGTTGEEWLAWLRKILAHNAADFVRRFGCTGKRQARREVPLTPANDSAAPWREPAAVGNSPSQSAIRREDELRVATALARLPADYQDVIVLRNLQRLPFDEVASRLGRSRPAAQMLWGRAIKKLQAELGE